MEIRISAKNLGAFAAEDACARCLWVKLRAGSDLPYQTFPGIFASIDSYTKKIIDKHITATGSLPGYVGHFGPLTKSIKPPHYSKFKRTDPDTGITVWGTPDAIFQIDGKYYDISDYKTARVTKHADSLLPVYEVQLNSYAWIGQENGIDPVVSLHLLYFEPQTDDNHVLLAETDTEYGFRMAFNCAPREVKVETGRIPAILRAVRHLADNPMPPASASCKDCAKLAQGIEPVGVA